MIDPSSINSIFDAKVFDRDGSRIGTVKQVYVDTDGGHPLFASVATGLFGTAESLLPLDGASFDGVSLRVEYDKDTVKDAPRVEADGALSEGEQDRLWDYYAGGLTPTTGPGDDSDRDAEERRHAARGGEHRADDATTRSEARGDGGARSAATGRVRLRKHVVTEQQEIRVPVQHEEITVEREPAVDVVTDEEVGMERGPGTDEDARHGR